MGVCSFGLQHKCRNSLLRGECDNLQHIVRWVRVNFLIQKNSKLRWLTKIGGCAFPVCVLGFLFMHDQGHRQKKIMRWSARATQNPVATQPGQKACKPILVLCQKASKSFLKVGCVNRPTNGLAKASLLFRTRPVSTEGVSTRLISGGSPEVPPCDTGFGERRCLYTNKVNGALDISPFSFPYSHASTVPWFFICPRGGLGCLGSLNSRHQRPPWHSHLLTGIPLFNTSVCDGKWQHGKQATAIFSCINPRKPWILIILCQKQHQQETFPALKSVFGYHFAGKPFL